MYSRLGLAPRLVWAIAGALLVATIPALGQVGETGLFAAKVVVTGKVLEKAASDIIAEARASAANVLSQAAYEGNIATWNAAQRLDLAAQNAAFVVGAESRRTVRELSGELQPLFAQLNHATEQIRRVERSVYRLKDAALLDVREATKDISGDYFFVQRIDGVAHLPRPQGHYRVAIWGVGLGAASTSLSSEVVLRIAGQAYQSAETDPSAVSSSRVFDLPVRDLNGTHKFDERVVHAGVFEIQQAVRPWLSRIVPGLFKPKESSYKVNFKLTLYPLTAGTLKVNWEAPTYAWRYKDRMRQSRLSGDHNCPKCPHPPVAPYSVDLAVNRPVVHGMPRAGNQRFALGTERLWFCDPGKGCCGGGHEEANACPRHPIFRTLYGFDFAKTVGFGVKTESVLRADYQVWGKPAVMWAAADVEEYVQTGVAASEKEFPVVYDSVLVITLPTVNDKAPVAVAFFVDALTRQSSQFALGSNTDVLLLQGMRVDPEAQQVTYLYKVMRPSDV